MLIRYDWIYQAWKEKGISGSCTPRARAQRIKIEHSVHLFFTEHSFEKDLLIINTVLKSRILSVVLSTVEEQGEQFKGPQKVDLFRMLEGYKPI